jgi:hypothetical protein
LGQGGGVNTTSFKKDIQRGKVGEQIFTEDFLQFLNIEYEDVTDSQGFQLIDSDYLAKVGLYEIKASYNDNKIIVIEEYTNINEQLAPISYGWFYKSKADMLVFVSKATRAMILIPFTDDFKAHYETIKDNYDLMRNKISVHNGSRWQSAFRKVPLLAINGYFAYYKKIQS